MSEDTENRAALLSAMTTEHFVQQTAISTTINEMATRTSTYIMALSSALVAMGFIIQSTDAFVPFAATVLPAVFLLGVSTALRLVDVAAENMQAHIAIARIRSFYRGLSDEAAVHFAKEYGRWPENDAEPSLRIGPLVGYMTTAAIMIAFIDTIVGAAGTALLALQLGTGLAWALVAASFTTAVLMVAFYLYQRLRIRDLSNIAQKYGSKERMSSGGR